MCHCKMAYIHFQQFSSICKNCCKESTNSDSYIHIFLLFVITHNIEISNDNKCKMYKYSCDQPAKF